MIEIRLLKDYDESQLKFVLDKINEVAPRELTYSLEADKVEGVDVNIKDKHSNVPANGYKSISSRVHEDLWVVIFQIGYIAYYQGERYGGDSLNGIIYDMFE